MKNVAVFDWKAVARAHREEADPREEHVLSHPELVVEEMPRNEADGNESRVVGIQNGCEDDLFESIVEVAAHQKHFLSYVNSVVGAAVKWFLASQVWHVPVVVDSQEWINFGFEYHEIQNDSKMKVC